MISWHRRREVPPFLASAPLRDLSGEAWLHSASRQGLYRFWKASGLKRALIPDYAPEGIYAPLRDAGLAVSLYPMPLDLRLDPGAFGRAVAACRPEAAVYIHPFGLYLEENLDTIRAALPQGALLLEDFALTLPCDGVVPRGEAALYAFPKVLGVPEGGLLKMADRAGAVPVRPPGGYGAPTPEGRELSARLERSLAWQDRTARLRAGPLLQKALALAAGKGADYYPYLVSHYRGIDEAIPDAARRILERIDFEAVTRRRRESARLYLDGLDPRFRLAPEPAHLRQALCAFPVKVDDQDRFHAFLYRGGIQGFRLTDRWWFSPGPPSPLYRRHYLLPMGHHLRDEEIRRVIDRANAYRDGNPD